MTGQSFIASHMTLEDNRHNCLAIVLSHFLFVEYLCWLEPDKFRCLHLVATESLGDLDTDSLWSIRNLAGWLSIRSAEDQHIAILIEYVLDK